MLIKKIAFFLLLVCLSFGCTPASNEKAGRLSAWLRDERIKVLCTTEMICDFVSEIGGQQVASLTLISGELDPHTYELVKGDDEKLVAADIIFYNGLGLEHGPSLHAQLAENPKAVGVGDIVYEHFPEEILHIDGQADPHIWLDVSLWSKTIDPICKKLMEVDPEHAAIYRQRADALLEKAQSVHQEVKTLLHSVPENRRYLVTSHDAFNYFTRAYMASPEEVADGNWKTRFQAPEGLAPEGQLSTADIDQILRHLLKYNIHVLFPESNVSQDSIRKIVDAAEEKGHAVWMAQTALYADAMGPKGSLGETYFGMVLWDAQTIVQYLNTDSLQEAQNAG